MFVKLDFVFVVVVILRIFNCCLKSYCCQPMKTKMAFEVLATKKARLEPMPVLPERFVRPVQRTTVQIATVVDKKYTSSIVKSLSEQFPLKVKAAFHHLGKLCRSQLGLF